MWGSGGDREIQQILILWTLCELSTSLSELCVKKTR